MSKSQHRKGYRVEHEIEITFRQAGIDAKRVPLSGSTNFAKGDVQISHKGKTLTVEVKARRSGFKQLYDWLEGKDALIVKADRKTPLVVLRLDDYITLLKEGK